MSYSIAHVNPEFNILITDSPKECWDIGGKVQLCSECAAPGVCISKAGNEYGCCVQHFTGKV